MTEAAQKMQPGTTGNSVGRPALNVHDNDRPSLEDAKVPSLVGFAETSLELLRPSFVSTTTRATLSSFAGCCDALDCKESLILLLSKDGLILSLGLLVDPDLEVLPEPCTSLPSADADVCAMRPPLAPCDSRAIRSFMLSERSRALV